MKQSNWCKEIMKREAIGVKKTHNYFKKKLCSYKLYIKICI